MNDKRQLRWLLSTNGGCPLFRLAYVAAVLGLLSFPAVARAEPQTGQPGGISGQFGDSPSADTANVVGIKAYITAPRGGEPARLVVTATIAPGYHIYSITQPPYGPKATKIVPNLRNVKGVRIGDFQAAAEPEYRPEAYDETLIAQTYEGTATWSAPLKLDAGIDLAKLTIPGTVTVQACTAKECRMPTSYPFTAALGAAAAEVAAPPTPAAAEPSPAAAAEPTPATAAEPFDLPALMTEIGLALLGGVVLNFMPCVLPVVSLKILAFVQQAGESRGRVLALNVWYSIGMLSVFMVLAALAAGVGLAGQRLAWGQQFTLPWFKIAMTGLVFAMALSFLGVWGIPIPGFAGTGRANQLQAKEGPAGAFFKGVFTTILATPCSAPLLGPVFGYLLRQPPAVVFCVFGAVGLGMASPYLVIGAAPRLIGFLPKPGAWMETFERLMGFLLLATVVYLFNTLTAVYFVPTLALLLGIGFACWLIGRAQWTTSPARKASGWLGGAAVAALVGWGAFTLLLAPPKIAWEPFSREALEQAQARGKTVMVDFTANWCPNCKANSKWAIETDAVRDLVRANRVVPLLADWTDESPTIKRAINELGSNSIPLLAIWPARGQGRKPVVRHDLLREDQVLDALKEAGPSRE
jgi:thiol:disulfide interchange protein